MHVIKLCKSNVHTSKFLYAIEAVRSYVNKRRSIKSNPLFVNKIDHGTVRYVHAVDKLQTCSDLNKILIVCTVLFLYNVI